MGDIADSIINGDFDQYTGKYIGRGDGFPRSKYRSGGQGGNIDGTINWLFKKKFITTINQGHDIIREYAAAKGIEEKKVKKICKAINKIGFGTFCNWVIKNKCKI